MHSKIRDIAVALVLAAATVAVYWPVRHFSFIDFDDPLYVTGNQHVSNGLSWDGVKYAFTTFDASNWHPLTWLSHMLDSELFVVEADGHFSLNPGGPHLVNVAIHVLNVVLLFVVLRWMTGMVWTSAFVAGAFALHPLHIESVAWVSERKDVLCTFFGLLAMLGYVGYARRPTLARYLAVIVPFALSLLTKPMFVTLPFLLFLLDYWPLKRIGVTSQPADGLGGWKHPVDEGPGWSWPIARRLVLEKVPLLALTVASCIMTLRAQVIGGSLERMDILPLSHRIGNAIVSYARYLGKTIWPSDLAILYPHPGQWSIWVIAASALILIAITITALATARKHPYFIVGWLWFLGMMVPVIGIAQVGVQAMADRYTYMPLTGLFIAVAWGITSLLGKARALMTAAYGVIALAALWLATHFTLPIWSDSETVYRHALQVTDRNWTIEYNLGVVLMGQVKSPQDNIKLLEANEHFKRALNFKRDFVLAHYMAADTFVRMGQVEKGMAGFRHVLQMDPQDLGALNNLAWLLATYPDPRLRNGTQAVALAKRACELTNDSSAAHLDTLAAAYAEAGRFDEAVDAANRARDLAHANNQPQLETEIASRLELYRAGKPYHMGQSPLAVTQPALP
jgi:hypothetical protein